MNKNIEVEVRGPLSKKEFDSLVKIFDVKGKKITEKNRVSIDYSVFLEGGVEDRQKDIRLRVTNGIPEIVIKIGSWGGEEQRKELSVLTKPGEFDKLTEMFAELGYKKGMLCERKSQVYEYEGIEFALVEVPGHSYYYEAEKMINDKEDSEQTVKELNEACKNLGLTVFSKREFFDYVHKLNKEVNEMFEYEPGNADYFKKRFNL